MVVMITSEEYKELVIKANKYDELQKDKETEKVIKKIDKFNVGDEVILLKEGSCTLGFKVGDKCRIISITSDIYPIEILKIAEQTEDEKNKDYGYVYETQIEKVKEEK